MIFRLHLRELSDHRLWLNGRAQPVAKCSPGTVSIYDVQQELAVSITDPLDVVRIFIPRTALVEIGRESGVRQVTGFNFRHGDATDDPVISSLVSSLLPSVGAPEAAFGLFVDHVMLALLTYVGRAYGAVDYTRRAARGKLAPWQERRAKEMLEADLNSNLRTAALAEACGLSPSHFARAFRQSTGLPPHRWLLNRRVDRAKELMLTTGMSLPDLAAACGFSDQSHLSRVFERVVGVPPGAWRRSHTCQIADF
ncbi:AraC family transcriptional regulator [Acidisphaera sp. L21]|uniref:AraC family transcriptional regulator n=1 Tax=Acidisphaera sp. L21 TaxID=1641851 RepID=UPI00131E6C13|nr:AraC family transcriptional regulator [Acidisphaera sp. L21]